MNDKVSVVVTCYNHEKYIAKCIKSLFEQTYQNIELIVFNDGSTDRSGEIISSLLLESPFKETKYFSGANQGVVKVRNAALEKITGEYLLFVDSDNFLNKDHIEILLRESKNHGDADIAYCQLWDFEAQRNILHEELDFILEDELVQNVIDMSSLVKTTAIKHAKFDENLKSLEDYDFWLNLILNNGAKAFFVRETKLNYRVLDSSRSQRDDLNRYYEDYLYILKKYKSSLGEKYDQAIKQSLISTSHNFREMSRVADERLLLIRNLEQELQHKEWQLQVQEKKIQELVSSSSYKLGNFIIHNTKRVLFVLKRPKLLLKLPKKIYRKLRVNVHPLLEIRKDILRPFRNKARAKNNYQNPKRALVYVVYAEGKKLQEYKIIFLKALAKLSHEIIVVVNGSLIPEDRAVLESFGRVEVRPNEGYDTAAFRKGILALAKDSLSQFDELLLVNDTNVGPFVDLESTFEKMASQKLDFWGISYGEPQADFTGYNKYKTIPIHLQSYFLVIEKSMFTSREFIKYWEKMDDTNSRNKAIGKHETVFTKHFEYLGFKHAAVSNNNGDSAMYIHPLTMLKDFGVPLVKYTAFSNYTDDKFLWQGISRKTQVPELIEYIKTNTKYPVHVIDNMMEEIKRTIPKEHVLIIDGVENAIPQCTRYRVENKAAQLRALGFDVWTVNASDFKMGYAENASHIIIYRTGYSEEFEKLCRLAQKYNKPVYYDIDDLVIDTKYTDLLSYTQDLSDIEKYEYDSGVKSYGKMMSLCDSVITTTQTLKEELENYSSEVIINRNLASEELVSLSQNTLRDYTQDHSKVKLGYFSGSITHNENFEMIKSAIVQILEKYPHVELHLVGYIDLPQDLQKYAKQIKMNPYVDWRELPRLISQMDINLAPLVDSVFNRAKSEIKWLEAALVKVPTVASYLGSFEEMVSNDETGLLAQPDEWYEKLEILIENPDKRQRIAETAYRFVLENCTVKNHKDEFTESISI
ncbi:rhamnan synthesis F family protein [Lactococcus formosensis]|uniref:Glycosyltransferase n=1 Tax=Lactococcus formosensis TaxID=1281486 RepID=A0A9X4P5D4_9LACT|nr:rhamnan synthesis F family protein [Lactococcus formosensis]MDG6141860.1 glycosyltransferase [Lactococcus formosensis]MDG6156130.1 glycosyltransferase [Lactococcus formosensis]MDG6159064.1 glycosyltransferase [Lactococcus formosensis]MDG6166669.1 glycosyltransferase [Lactococcus formosensis]MDG6171751.1 glycosyltransferase [Lactococcus formosensis]